MSELSELFGDEKIRFHVIDSENRQRSSDWIIWESNESVYLSAVTLSGLIKLSIHPSGVSDDGCDTQFGTTSNFWQNLRTRNNAESVPFHRWKRPYPLGNHICMIASISFPSAFLGNVVTKKKLSGRKLAFPLPAEGKALELALLSHRLNAADIEQALISKLYTPVICIALVSGENISIVCRYVEFPMSVNEMFSLDRAQSNWMGEPIEIGQSMENSHAIVIREYPKDGEPLLLAEINGFTLTRNA